MDRAKQYYDGDFGTITAGKVNIGQDITFATVQTMVKLNLSQYAKEWNVIIVDECHRVAGSPTKVMQFYKVLSNLNARHKYGLSATLHRADEMIKSTYAMLGNVVYAITDKDVSQKVIKSRHMKIETHVPWSEAYLETDGTMNYAGLIEYLTKSKERNYLIANHLVHHKHEFNLVLSARVNHLVELKNICESFGLEAELVIGSINNQKRSEIFERVRQGHLHIILSTYALAKEGLDIPNLNRLHLATPQKNKSVTKQAAGRVERRIHDKHDAMILDYVDEHISYCETMYKKRKSILK
jgi:superfamily II DNA or RNA helicase